MRKIGFILVVLFFGQLAWGQSGKIVGKWLMIEAEKGGKVQQPYVLTEFKKDGTLQLMGVAAGKWEPGAKENEVSMQSKFSRDFNGTAKILKLTPEKLILTTNDTKYTYSRVDSRAIAGANQKSGLAGRWKLSGTDYTNAFLQFSLPDSFLLIQVNPGETDRSSGSWIFNPKEHTIIFMGFSHLLRGKIPIVLSGTNAFQLTLADRSLKAERLQPSETKIEFLHFKEEDFPEEEPEGMAAKLPWQDFDKMVQVLGKIQSLQYSYGKLVEAFNTLSHTNSILSKIRVDAQKPRVEFTNLSVSGTDTSQFSQRVKGNLQEAYNNFFPREEPYPYRVSGVEKITVPAGTFTCTVIEGIDGEKKVKYWMINDLPGVYAKIIREKTDPFGELDYSLSELEKITYRK